MGFSASQRNAAKVGRNDPCPCRSGKKYKKCCGGATGQPLSWGCRYWVATAWNPEPRSQELPGMMTTTSHVCVRYCSDQE
ncbi:MAG: SEC-C metal-binding domain-containing protein [Candidatus Sulfotelmatobacter sp.]